MTSLRLSVVIPCYNEAANLPLLVPRCAALTKACKAEVILVDNGSQDDSPVVLAQLLANESAVRTVRVERNQGYGFGILAGLRAAKGDVLAWTHADMQTDPMDAVVGFKLFDAAPDQAGLFVKGRRYGRPAADVLFTVGMSVFETALMQSRLWDINAQPTMFSREFFDTWSSPPNDFSLDLFAYYKARRSGLAIKRFPVQFGKRAYGRSHWNVNWAAKRKFIQRTVAYSLTLRRTHARH